MDRASSARYRWEDDAVEEGASDKQRKYVNVSEHYLLVRQRVAQAVDTTGWGTVLVLGDVFLSVVSVVLYIAMTYQPPGMNGLYQVDLALACAFAANWVFWLWVAEDRLRYIFSFLTLVDVLTVIPAFILYSYGAIVNETLPGLNFLRVLRILRMLRVFRMKHIMRRHLEGAVTEAAGKLVFSLLSVLFIAAGLFYELEKYGPPDDKKHKDLKFHECIYWSAVTVSTLGFGDIVPTYWATQVMVIGLLMMTFTLLPYLTGQLMDALTSTSPYQRKIFQPSRRADVSHVVITGWLDGATVRGLLDELYHEDKGFNHNSCVLLSERAPSNDVKHLLATHQATRKLSYLQGSPFRTEDLHRAAAEYAMAYFVIAPKYPEDPTVADRYLSMCVLSLGQFLQEAHVALQQRLSYAPNRAMHWIKHGTVQAPDRLPAIYLQLCLPEGRLRLFQVLQSLQDRHSNPAAAFGNDHATAKGFAAAAAEAHGQSPQQSAAAGAAGVYYTASPASQRAAAAAAHHDTGLGVDGVPPAGAAARSDEAQLGQGGDTCVDLSAYTNFTQGSADTGACAASAARAADGSSSSGAGGCFCWCCHSTQRPAHVMPAGCQFWREFSRHVRVLCLSEVKYAMMAQSVVGVPGAMTMLCNLSTTVDLGLETLAQLSTLPPWLAHYMMGASQEIYQLTCFPATLVGRTVKEAAGFIFDSCHAVLLAVEATRGPLRHRMTVGDLQQVITRDMHGYIIASDAHSLTMISSAQPGDFELWHAMRQQHLMQQLTGQQPSFTDKQQQQQPDDGGVGRLSGKRLAGLSRGAQREAAQQNWKSALTKTSSIQMRQVPPQKHKLLTLAPRRWSDTSVPSATASTTSQTAPGHDQFPSYLEPFQELDVVQQQQQQQPQPQQTQPQPQQSQPSLQQSQTQTQTLSCPGASPFADGAVQPSGPPSQQVKGAAAGSARGPPHSVTLEEASTAVAAMTAASGAAGTSRSSNQGYASSLGVLLYMLRSPSRLLREQGQAFVRRHYHMRPPGATQSGLDMVMEEVDLVDHLIVLGVPASQDGLLSLLAALRSRRLTQWRPVVIIDSKPPSAGGSWEAIAQFTDVYFIEVREGLNDALLRASAERAAQAILMTPLTSHDQEGEDHRLASKVMSDALVMSRYQLLRSLNPRIQLVAEIMLPKDMAYLSPTTPVKGVDQKYLHLLSPAYISGSVFHARLLDDLVVASYCNNASDRIILQLLHRWHMGWAGPQAFNTMANEQQELLFSEQELRQLEQAAGQQWEKYRKQYQALQQQQLQEAGVAVDSDPCHDQAAGAGSQQQPSKQRQHHAHLQEQVRLRFKLAATVLMHNHSKAAVGQDAAAAARAASAALNAAATEQHGVPTLLQIPVECPPGTTYGRYFHSLLHTRGLLLLGVHRCVQQDGLSFRATITNPSYHSLMEPEDNAFVVARLPLPADSTDTAAVAAAWPPDTLGYSNLKPQPPQQPDLVLAELAALHAQDAQAQPGVSGGDSNSGSSLGGGLWPLRQRTRSTASAPGAGAVGGASAQPVHAWSDPQPVRYSTLQQLDRNSDSSPARARGEGSGRASHDASSLGRADSGYSAPEPIVRGDSGYADGPAGGLSADVSTAAAGGVPSIREAGPGGQQQQQQPERVRSILVKVPGVQGAVMHTSSGKGRNTGVSFARAAGEQQDDAS